MSTQQTLEEAFPTNIDPQFKPFGTRILLQMRRQQAKTKSGILLIQETVNDKKFMEQIARVHSMGPLAFRNRNTLEPWSEGVWCKEGDFVRIPRWGGDRWLVKATDGNEDIPFIMLSDHEIFGLLTGDPMTMNVYIA